MSNLRQIKSLNDKVLCLDKVGIIYNSQHKEALQVVETLEKTLNKYNISTIKKFIVTEKEKNIFDKDITLAIAVGGDGTFLGAARFYATYDVPVFGINIGRLGFLAQFSPADIEEGIKNLINGNFKIEERLMLKTSASSDNTEFSYSALNDVVIKGGAISRTSRLFLYLDNKHLCDYIADGLIISTPTGSTAYNLSAGGPVVVPELDAIVITPICPHALTTRPIMIPANEEIRVKITSDADFMYLTADGQENVKLKNNDSIFVKQNDFKAKLILLEKENNGFYSILREKLHWGISPGCQC